MDPVPLRKRHAGADSYGHTWPKDGAVVDVDYDQALVLLAIPDGGFTVADQPAGTPVVAEPDPAEDMSEVDPREDDATDKPAPTKKTTARRTTKS